MEKKMKKLNETVFLTLVVGITLLIMVLLKAFLPAAILMELSIPNIAGICLLALLINYYFGDKEKENPMIKLFVGVIVFGLFPLLAGMADTSQAGFLAIVGGVEYTIISLLFTSMTDRMEATIKSKFAPIPTAFCLFLTFQCFANILL